jgi:hypothetical protein
MRSIEGTAAAEVLARRLFRLRNRLGVDSLTWEGSWKCTALFGASKELAAATEKVRSLCDDVEDGVEDAMVSEEGFVCDRELQSGGGR